MRNYTANLVITEEDVYNATAFGTPLKVFEEKTRIRAKNIEEALLEAEKEVRRVRESNEDIRSVYIDSVRKF